MSGERATPDRANWQAVAAACQHKLRGICRSSRFGLAAAEHLGKLGRQLATSSSGPVPTPKSRRNSDATPWALALTCLACALICNLFGLFDRALWDPPELAAAEFGRRIARAVFGASWLPSAPAELVPTRSELGHGELPSVAVALAFRVFGLHAWAGRLALLWFALAGLGATYFAAARLASRRAGWLAVLVLGCFPPYFLQARTLQGDVVTFAGIAAATGGLAVAVFDEPRRARVAGALLALIGTGAAFWVRGVILGVAVPLVGVGGAWLCLAMAGKCADWPTRAGSRLALAALVLGALASALGISALLRTPPNHYSLWVGALTGGAEPSPTFDIVLRDLGHAAFPWSALLVPALGRLFRPPAPAEDPRREALLLVALCTAASALFAETWLTAELGLLPFVAPSALALLIALSCDDIDRHPGASRGFALAVAALGLLLLLDVRNAPERALAAFALPDSLFPESFAVPGFVRLAVPSLLAFVAFFFVVEQEPSDAPTPFFRSDYLAWPKTLLTLWHGQLWFVLLVCFFGLIGFELLLAASDRGLHLVALEGLSTLARLAVRAGWLALVTLLVAPSLVALARDSTHALLDEGGTVQRSLARRFGWGAPKRGSAACGVFALAALAQAALYYPALLRAMSPEQAFEAYAARAQAGAPLGAWGVNPALARYHTGTSVHELHDADGALDWLLAPGERRFLAIGRANLPNLNAAHRLRTNPHRNALVVDARGEIALVSNRLQGDERQQNPLASLVLDQAPQPQHPLDVSLAGKLDVLGWEVRDRAGKLVSAISAGDPYEFIIYYRVIDRVAGHWDTFLHLDGFQRRYNGDHATLDGNYPTWLWLPGDVLADRHVVRLEPNFERGRYRVYFGLYSGARRLEVRRGTHEENRIVAGDLEVR